MPASEDSIDSRDSGISLRRMALANIRHAWQVTLSVALGVATATAVIVGALLVGDSMRGSLRALTIERLGKTDSAIIPGGFFTVEHLTAPDIDPVALILFTSGVVESRGRGSEDTLRRAGSVQIIGCDERFWQLDVSGVHPTAFPSDDGVVLNQAAADELQVGVGDLVTVRLPVEQAVPADSPLGRRDVQTQGLPRMKVLDIIADRGIGRFSLDASQAAPQNVFVDRETIGKVLDRAGQANAMLFDTPVTQGQLNIDLSDLGLKLNRVGQEFGTDNENSQTVLDYYSLTSDRLLLPESAVNRIVDQLERPKRLE